MSFHRQDWVKVNTQVDGNISVLISTLAQFYTLQTIESCEGDDNHQAFICFYFGNNWESDWREAAEFAFNILFPALRMVGDMAHIAIRIQPSGCAIIDLSIRPGCIRRVNSCLKKALKLFTSSLLHMKECSDGMSGKDQPRCS